MSVPALRALRQLLPNAHITLATKSSTEAIFAEADFVNELLIFTGDSVMAQAAKWREQKFDAAILFPNSFKVALVAKLARIPLRLGYATEGRGFLLSNAAKIPDWRSERHESFFYLNLIAELEQRLFQTSNTLSQGLQDQLQISEQRQSAAAQFLRDNGVRGERPLIAICPGSINSRAKRWPADRFAALADRLQAELKAEVLLIGSPAELEVSREVTAAMNQPAITLTGQTDLAMAGAILSQVDLLITNDTGPAHLAAALRRPTLVIFGPTNPLTTRPLSEVAEIVRIPPECAPCMLRDCPIDHRCMTAIEVDDVFARAVGMLREHVMAN